jgi:integrase
MLNTIIDLSEDGDNSLHGETNAQQATDNPLGTSKGKDKQVLANIGDDSPVEIAKIIDRFENNTKLALRPQTRALYIGKLRTFAQDCGLSKYTKNQLRGNISKKLLLDHIETKPLYSRRFVAAALKCVWEQGLELAWPLDRYKLGKLPTVRRCESPRDELVKEWVEALEKEPDSYLRITWDLIALGLRPSHVSHIRWKNILYNDAGEPVAIVADGATEGFKTNSPVKARLAEDVATLLLKWREEVKRMGLLVEDNPILPWRSSVDNSINPSRVQGIRPFIGHWNTIREKWKLPKLRAKDMRHWVATQCRKHGLSKQASAALMGHDPKGITMRDWYDNPPVSDIFEEQKLIFPNGPVGSLKPAKMTELAEFTTEELDLLHELKAGQIDSFNFMNRWNTIKKRPVSAEQLLKP